MPFKLPGTPRTAISKCSSSTPRPMSTRGLHTRIARLTGRRPLACLAIPTTVEAASYSREAHTQATTTSTTDRPRNIAVLGGGITGLTTAHYLAREAGPKTKITLYEASHRLGGWLETEALPVDGAKNGQVLLQRGPRTLRSMTTSFKYDDLVLYEVLHNLGLHREAITSGGSGASDRFIYYPDHLVRLPGSFSTSSAAEFGLSLLREPLFDGIFHAGWKYLTSNLTTVGGPSPQDLRKAFAQDESVADFIKRVFGPRGGTKVVDNMISAVLHGINGGDVYKLSAKSTMFDQMWYSSICDASTAPGVPREGRSWAWLPVKDIELMQSFKTKEEPSLMALYSANWKLLSFEDGLMTLVNGLKEDLEKNPNVTIKYGEPITSLRYEQENDQIEITTPKSKKVPQCYDKVISTLFSGTLNKITSTPLRQLQDAHAVSIMVVNLYYPRPGLNAPYHGFGYLIPRSVPLEQNPEQALGVLFDSDTETRPTAPGTKLTVMLGGHWWDQLKTDELPTDEEGIEMAKSLLKRHLGIDEKEPVYASAHLARECLTQHYVGHKDRMRSLHWEVENTFKGRLAVAGGSYTSVGVIPAMRAGRDIAVDVAAEGKLGRGQSGVTGLEEFVQVDTEESFGRMVPMRREDIPLRKWNFENRMRAELAFNRK